VNIGISSGFFSIGYGSPAAACHMSTYFSRRNPLSSSTNRSSVFTFDFVHTLLGFGRGGDTGGVDRLGIYSSRRRSSCSWMVRASFSKYSGFSLAFTRGLRRWLLAVALLDLRFPLRWQCALAADSKQDLLRMAASVWGEKP
jgi:hypothetical protein